MLRQAIEALCRQEDPGCAYEVIAVDNGSKDDTRQMVEALAKDSAVPVRCLFEPRGGSHYARNTGFKAGRGDVLGLIDDDVIVDSRWVRNMVRVYDNPVVSCAGGPLELRWINGSPPDWIGPFKGVIGEINYGEQLLELHYPRTVNAGNFSIRKDMLLRVGGYNPCNAPGDKLIGDGECGLCWKVYQAGGHIFWVPDARGWHVQDASRVTFPYIRRRARFQGMTDAYTLYRRNGGASSKVLKDAIAASARRALNATLLARHIVLKHVLLRRPGSPREDLYRAVCDMENVRGLWSYLASIRSDPKLRELVRRSDWLNV